MKTAARLLVSSAVFLAALLAGSDARAGTETLAVSFDTSDNSTNSEGFWNNIGGPQLYDHVVAVWLEDSNGNYVKTLFRWANMYPHDLYDWPNASGMDVDAVTAATRTSAGPHTTGAIDITMLPDRTYKIQLESNDLNNPPAGQTNRATYTFNKNGTFSTQTPAGTGGFSSVTITYSGRAGAYLPGVHAGPDRWVTLPGSAALSGLATDDDGIDSVSWSTVGGPPSAGFSPTDNVNTTATFPRDGIYVLRLTATDNAVQSRSDDVTVFVNTMDIVAVADSEVTSVSPDFYWPNNDFRIRVWRHTDGTGNREGFIKFNLSGVPGEVTAAIFRLSMNDFWGSAFTCDVQGVADGWTEGGISWNNSRGLTGTVLATFQADNPLWTEMDVTAFVAAEHASNQVASLRISHQTILNVNGSRFNTREKNVKPTLRITYNRLPTAAITSPSGGLVANPGENITFTCTAGDPDDPAAALTYSWYSDVEAAEIGATDSFSRSDLSAGNHTVTLTVTDPSGGQRVKTVNVTVGSYAPVPTIASPGNNAKFVEGEMITFQGSATDQNTNDTPALDWSSDVLGGSFGAGATVAIDTLSVGVHVITLTADDGSLTGTDTINIEIYADFDGDGLPDWWEDKYAALDSADDDSDGDSILDGADDADDDGYTNLWEYRNGTNPTVPNTGGGGGGVSCAAAAGSCLSSLAAVAAALFLLRRGRPRAVPFERGE